MKSKILTCFQIWKGHIDNKCLDGRSATGICMGAEDETIIVINWRSKAITEMTLEGETKTTFSHKDLKEPIDIAFDADKKHILVADNGIGAILIFDETGKLLKTISPEKKKFKDLSAICVAPSGQYIATDANAIHVFSDNGKTIREIAPPSKGRFGGLTCDNKGFLLATHTSK